jgi:hypothetical protein
LERVTAKTFSGERTGRVWTARRAAAETRRLTAKRARVVSARTGAFCEFCAARADRYHVMALGTRMGPKKRTRDLIL